MAREITAPTVHLPHIRQIPYLSSAHLSDALGYLRGLYVPEVRGTRRRRRQLTDSNAIDPNPQILLSHYRSDSFERSYAIRWLTALVEYFASGKGLRGISGDVPLNSDSTAESAERLLAEGASLLAICAGTAAAGILARTFSFTPHDAHIDREITSGNAIVVQVTDVPLENHDFSSVGAQTWGAACVLAEMMVDEPATFGFALGQAQDKFKAGSSPQRTLRVLELGAGTGLVSLVAGKLLQARQQRAEIVATDFHPSALRNLQANISANFPESSSSPDSENAVSLSCCALDWSAWPANLNEESPTIGPLSPVGQLFDVVLGADIVYEPEHATWIKSIVERLLRKPTETEHLLTQFQFHLLIPLRSSFTAESCTVEQVFPLAPDPPSSGCVETAVLSILHKEILACDVDNRGEEELCYAYYRIGWSAMP